MLSDALYTCTWKVSEFILVGVEVKRGMILDKVFLLGGTKFNVLRAVAALSLIRYQWDDGKGGLKWRL